MGNSKWYEKSYRRNLVDMHIEDWNDEFLSKFDPRDYYENLRRAGIKSPMLYIQSHVGYCYWPAKSGHMHNAFRGREHAMRDLFDMCHDGGMDVVAYYSLIYNNWAYENHPEWRMLTLSGRGSRDNGGRYGLCCPNNQEYRNFVTNQIDDFSEYFDFEGIFLDMTFWPLLCCYCDSCKSRWEKEIGGEMPVNVDWNDPQWLVFVKKREEWLGEFAWMATDRVKMNKPGCSVEHQNSTVLHNWMFGVNLPIIEASDYAGGDFYGGIEQQSLACKLYYTLTKNQPFEYMTSRCYPALYEHTTTKPEDMLYQSVMMTYAHHGAALIIDAIDPAGTMDKRVYETIGSIFESSARYEPFLEGFPKADVGIYFSMSGKMNPAQAVVPADSGDAGAGGIPHLDAVLGASNSLRKHHIPYWIVGNNRLDMLDNLKVLVVPDSPFMDEKDIARIKEFVLAGGKLYFSRYSAPSLAEEIFGLTYDGLTEESVTYFSPTATGHYLMPQFTENYPMTVMTTQARLSGEIQNGTQVLATMTLPYADGSRFSSIHSNPPGNKTMMPSLLRANYGKGTVIWSAAPFEGAVRVQHSDVFADLILDLNGPFSSTIDAPEYIEHIVFNVLEKNRILVSLVNIQDQFRFYETQNIYVKIKTNKAPVSIYEIPDRNILQYTFTGEEVIIPVDSFHIFKMIAVDFPF
ncbi:MAG: alpha-L-fucosidase [Saccharofermentanales bacterium]